MALADSTDVLFQDAPVRSYSLEFYGDTAWSTKLESMWKADSGYLPARFNDGQVILDSVGVRYKGNSSFTLAGNNPKKPLKIKFNEFKDLTYYGVKILNFSNGIGDPTQIREHIGYTIARRILPAPRANFAQLTLAGKTLGLYTQVEQADKSFLKQWYENAKGNLFKAGDDGASLGWIDAKGASYAGSGDYELKTNEKEANWNGFVRFVDFVNNSSDEAFCAERANYLDDDNLAKFLAFNTVLSHFDSYNGSGRNWYMYQPDTGKATMSLIPWDLNLAFGAYGGASSALGLAIDTVQAPLSERPLFRRMLGCAGTRDAYYRWVRELSLGDASSDSIEAMVVRDSALVAAFVEADANKFYPLTAWKTNLRANYRGSEGIVPGLVSFATSRNATIATQLQTHTSAAPRSIARAWRFAHRGDVSVVEGLESLGGGSVHWSTLDGKSSGSIAFDARTDAVSIPLPTGVAALVVRSARGHQTLLVLSPRK